MKADDEPNMMDIDVLKEIARDRSATVPQVLIAWHNHRGCAAIPKSTTKDHIISNFRAADVSLTDSDMKKIAKLDRHYRYINGKFFEEPSRGYENLYDE
jgi:alcohol dehydrogenase (NADP+)